MDSLSFTEIITGIVAVTITIQVTLGTIAYKVLSSRYTSIGALYELQLRFEGQRADRAEKHLEECEDDLDQCRERVRRQNGGILT